MDVKIVKNFREIHGSKYVVLMDDNVICIDNKDHYVASKDDTSPAKITHISTIYITKHNYEILTKTPFSKIHINHVKCNNGIYLPIENGIPEGIIWVKIHWEGYLNINNEDYTVEDFNCLAIRFKKPGKKSKGKNRLQLDSNSSMRQALVSLLNWNKNISIDSEKAVIYHRTSLEKDESKKENSIDSQNECNLEIAKKFNLYIVDQLSHNGKSGGSSKMNTPNTDCPLFNEFINGEFKHLIVKYPHRLCRKVSKFMEIYQKFKEDKRNIISLISDCNHPKYGSIINTDNDIFLANMTDEQIGILMDRRNFTRNPLPNSLYMSLVNKSIFLMEIHEAEVFWEKTSAEAKINADFIKKRKLEELVLDKSITKLSKVFSEGNREEIKKAMSLHKALEESSSYVINESPEPETNEPEPYID